MVVTTLLLGVSLFTVVTTSMCNTLGSFSILMVVFNTVLLVGALGLSNNTTTVGGNFVNVYPSGQVRTLVVKFSFYSFVRTTTKFNAPTTLTKPLVIDVKFPPLYTTVMTLLYSSITISFNTINAPMASTLGTLSLAGSTMFATHFDIIATILRLVTNAFLPLIVLVLMAQLFKGRGSMGPTLGTTPFTVFAKLSFAMPVFLVAMLVNCRFTSLVKTLVSVVLAIATTGVNFLIPGRC